MLYLCIMKHCLTILAYKYFVLFLLAITAVSCSNGGGADGYENNVVKVVKEPPRNIEILLPTTPVKNQGRSEFCWIYTMLAAIETDCLAQGDSVNLSPLWLERKLIEQQASRAFLAGDTINLRGTLPMAMNLFQRHGIQRWDSYCSMKQPDGSTAVTARKAWRMAIVMSRQHKGLAAYMKALDSLLDDELGPLPKNVFMDAAEYTPLEYAHSCSLAKQWKAYTSFTHHPYGEAFCVEVPDNRYGDEAMNVTPDSLLSIIESSLKAKHPVMWEGCMRPVNIPGDIATLRQSRFENHLLTDDHCMCIIGMGRNVHHERFFILKNSWGTDAPDHGYRTLTARQLLLSTIMIMARNDG